MPVTRRILITGASVAGNTAVRWLGRAGFGVTVFEDTSGFRNGGQNIDVRGVGCEVLRHMALEQAALDLSTGEKGAALVNKNGKITAEFLTNDTVADGRTAEVEISRGDLNGLLYEPARERAPYRLRPRLQRWLARREARA